MWVYGRTDLTDYYRDVLTLRQVWVRLQALPPDTPFWAAMAAEHEQAEGRRKVVEIEDALSVFTR